MISSWSGVDIPVGWEIVTPEIFIKYSHGYNVNTPIGRYMAISLLSQALGMYKNEYNC
jgi:hypothetical protein